MLASLLLFNGLSDCALASPEPTDTDASPTPKEIVKGELALARLQDLGASVQASEIDEAGKRRILISFSFSLPVGLDGRPNGSEPKWWKGDDSDFVLLKHVGVLGELYVTVECNLVSARALSNLQPTRPLAELLIRFPKNPLFQELTSLPACRRMSIQDSNLTPETFRHVAQLASIESLSLDGRVARGLPSIGDEDLAELAGLKHLTELHLSYAAVTPAGLKHLAAIKGLERVYLEQCPLLENSDLAGLVGPDSLRTLELNFQLPAAALPNIARLGSLKKLYLQICDCTPADVAPLGRLSHLEALSIHEMISSHPLRAHPGDAIALGDAIATAAAKSPDLKLVRLGPTTTISQQGLETLTALPHLESLSARLPEVNDESLVKVGRLKELRELSLGGPGKLSDRGLRPLQRLTQLRVLSLPGAGLTDEGIARLAELRELRDLYMSGGKITGTGLAALGRLQELRTLDLGNSLFNDAGCLCLPLFAKLRTLNLPNTQITNAGLESMAALADLDTLIIRGNKAITDTGIAHLRRLKHLELVNAFDTSASGSGVAGLREAIPGVEVAVVKDNSDPFFGVYKTRNPRAAGSAFGLSEWYHHFAD